MEDFSSFSNFSSFIIDYLQSEFREDAFWNSYLQEFNPVEPAPYAVHLAIFIEPYLQFILDGKKTVESRFSSNRCAPYEQVNKGDLVLLKKSGGPIVGICQVSTAWSYLLDSESWREIRTQFTEALCAEDPEFWASRQKASFATLMKIQEVRTTKPLDVKKRDRRGWVVIKRASEIPFSSE